MNLGQQVCVTCTKATSGGCCRLPNNVSTVIFSRLINWKGLEINCTLIILTPLDSSWIKITPIYPKNIAERLSFALSVPSPLSIWCCDVPCCELLSRAHGSSAACGEMQVGVECETESRIPNIRNLPNNNVKFPTLHASHESKLELFLKF